MNQKKILNNLLLYLVFFLIFLAFAHYFGSKYYNPSALHAPTYSQYLHLSVNDVATLFGAADMASYAKAAIILTNQGTFPLFAKLWPPGQPFLITAIMYLTGPTSYPLKMLYLTATTWALMFLLIYQTLDQLKNRAIRFFLCLIPMYLTLFQNSTIFNLYLTISESLAIPLSIITLCLFIHWLKTNNNKYLFSAALCLALTSYFRAFFEMFGSLLTVLVVMYIVLKILKSFSYKLSPLLHKENYTHIAGLFSKKASAIFIAIIIFNACLLPWKLLHLVRDQSFSWVIGQDYEWVILWDPTQITATGHIACDTDPALCQLIKPEVSKYIINADEYKNLAIMTLIANPITWYSIKLKSFNVLWYGPSWNDLLHGNAFLTFIEGTAILIAGLGALAIGLIKTQGNEKILYYMILLFLIFNIAIYTLFHFELRYSLYLQLVFIYLPLWLFFGFKRSDATLTTPTNLAS